MAKTKKAEKPKEYTITDRDGDHTFRLAAPASPAMCHSIILAANDNQLMGLSAALGACWRGPGRPTPKISAFKFDFLRYGQAVFDELHGRGVTVEAVMEASTDAFTACMRNIMSGEEVQAFTDFIEKEGESTT